MQPNRVISSIPFCVFVTCLLFLRMRHLTPIIMCVYVYGTCVYTYTSVYIYICLILVYMKIKKNANTYPCEKQNYQLEYSVCDSCFVFSLTVSIQNVVFQLFIRHFQTFPRNDCNILHSHQQCLRVLVALYFCQHLVFHI